MYKDELGTANAHKILLKDIGKLFLPEAPVPHCLIEVQWGNDTTSDYDISPSSSKSFNFPISFSKNCFIVLPVLYGSWGGCVVWVYSKTLTNCTVKFEEWSSNTQRVHLGYIAIGN